MVKPIVVVETEVGKINALDGLLAGRGGPELWRLPLVHGHLETGETSIGENESSCLWQPLTAHKKRRTGRRRCTDHGFGSVVLSESLLLE